MNTEHEKQLLDSANRLIQLHPKEPFTFPHLTMTCRVNLLVELLRQSGK